MNFASEFGTVDLILNSDFKTKTVDAFSLSLIKVEKQIRKVFTNLIFQHPNFGGSDVTRLRSALVKNRSIYFEGFIEGINRISKIALPELYGQNYSLDLKLVKQAILYRNKIFHGQITDLKLNAKNLHEEIVHLKRWSERISEIFKDAYDFDGFERNSYQKKGTEQHLKNLNDFDTVEKYESFLQKYLAKHKSKVQ